MSRFDRRLKGGGLRPGQSTCKIRNAPAKVMSSGFTNTKVGSNYATAYNPVVPGVNLGMAQQNFQVQPSAPSQQQEEISQNKVYISQEDLGAKNRKLEQYALTAPSQEMRTLTMHEIRLNKLEWINDQAEKMMDEEENVESKVNIADLIDAKLSTYTLTTLEPHLKSNNLTTQSNNSNNSNNGDNGELKVKFNNLNTVSMKVQQDVNILKSDVKIIKGGIKSFATNLQGIAMMKKELDSSKREINNLRASYKKLKEDVEKYLLKSDKKQVQLKINEIEGEKKKMEESEVRDVVVKAIKNKSVN